MEIPNISVEDVKKKQEEKEDFIFLDVRRPDELETASIRGTTNIPMQQLEGRIEELDKGKEIIVFCHHGGRAKRATKFLLEKGFKKTKNLEGGIDAWSEKIDASVPKY